MKQIEWIYCPICSNKTRNRIREDTVLKNYPLYCPKCKQEVLVEAKDLQVTVIKEPDALDVEQINKRVIAVYRLFSFYIGTVICHKTYTSKINHIRKALPDEEHFVHENFAPAIISKEKWEQVQFIFDSKRKNNVRAGSSKPCHRYTGLIECGDCGCTFVCKKRKWKDKPDRFEYNCNGYHRYGKEHCTPHRIDEKHLDKLIYDELMSIKDEALAKYKSIESDVRKCMSNKNSVNNKLKQLTTSLEQRKSDQKEILLERIRDREHADIYTEMLEKCESDIQKLEDEIKSIQDYNATIKKRKAEMKDSARIIEEIIKEGAISDANLRLLVDKIIIFEKDKKLSIKIRLNAKFQKHKDCYDDNGNLTDSIFTA